MKKTKYLRYNIGEKKYCSHLDATHAENPKSDLYTGKFVDDVISRINASGIIATVSRTEMDLNRPRNKQNAPAIDEYRMIINKILISKDLILPDNTLAKNYLHIAIHGMKDDHGTEFEIGTYGGMSCSPEIQEWFLEKLKAISPNIGVNNIFQGDPSKCYHRNGDPDSNYPGYGDKFHTIQIEICKQWRINNSETIINILTETITTFDKVFN